MMRDPAVSADQLVIFIGGFWDRITQIVCGYSGTFGLRQSERKVIYFEYDQTKRIVATATRTKLQSGHASVVLVGHSWGAVTAIAAAALLGRKGSPADLVVTIDPVSRKRIITDSATTTWINVNAAPTTSNGWNGDYYAALGGKWRNWPASRAQCHYDAPYHHNEFRALLEYAPPGEASALDCVLATGPNGCDAIDNGT